MVTPTNRRKFKLAAMGASLLILFVALAMLNAFNTQLPKPATTQQIVIFTGLSIVAFLLFVAVLILLVRNVLKLYADQRSRVMGTRLQNPDALGRCARQPDSHRRDVRLQLPVAQSRRRPLVFPARHRDAR